MPFAKLPPDNVQSPQRCDEGSRCDCGDLTPTMLLIDEVLSYGVDPGATVSSFASSRLLRHGGISVKRITPMNVGIEERN